MIDGFWTCSPNRPKTQPPVTWNEAWGVWVTGMLGIPPDTALIARTEVRDLTERELRTVRQHREEAGEPKP